MSVWPTAPKMAEGGIAVFPCWAGRKEPATPHGFRDATTDPGQIERWAEEMPDANLAVPTGHRSGWLVLDVDPPHGVQTVRAIESDLGGLPETRMQETPRGGLHRIYRMPTDAVIRCSAGRLCGAEAPGFDVRADGGYIVVAPSVVGGRPYRWTNRMAPAELPGPWVRALSRPVREAAPVQPWTPRDDRERDRVERWVFAALRNESRDVAATGRGARNDRLWCAAAALGGLIHTGGIDAQDVRRALAWACGQWGKEQSPRKDAGTVERGIAFGLAHPRPVPNLEVARG